MKIDKSKLLTAIIWASFITAIIWIVSSAYLYLVPQESLMVNQGYFPMVDKELKRGEEMKVRANFCKYTDVSPEVSVSLINDTIVGIPFTVASFPKGCYDKEISIGPIPHNTVNGRHQLRFQLVYRNNFLNKKTYTIYTDQFNVID